MHVIQGNVKLNGLYIAMGNVVAGAVKKLVDHWLI
jgi:hypothetical protein